MIQVSMQTLLHSLHAVAKERKAVGARLDAGDYSDDELDELNDLTEQLTMARKQSSQVCHTSAALTAKMLISWSSAAPRTVMNGMLRIAKNGTCQRVARSMVA